MTTKTQTAAERAAEAIHDTHPSRTLKAASITGKPMRQFCVEEIAAIIAREYDELENTVERLAKEVGGLMAISEHELRVAAGNTNVSCLIGKLQEVNDALKRVRGQG